MPNQYWAEVVTHQDLGGDFWLLTLNNEELAREAKPGQFLHIKVSPGLTPLLRRPISIHDVVGAEIKILYQVLGEGTRLLTKFIAGDKIDVMGPLGNGFSLNVLNEKGESQDNASQKVAVVAGGIGTAPLMYLVKELVAKGSEVTLYQGGRSKEYLLGKEQFEALKLDYKIATDDGSFGHHGFVTELLEEDLNRSSSKELSKDLTGDLKEKAFDYIYSCGPHLMLRGVAKLAEKYNVPSEVSLEERMGCATGACLACVCKVKVKDSVNTNNCNNDQKEVDFTYKKVCLDGPVFKGEEVVFDD